MRMHCCLHAIFVFGKGRSYLFPQGSAAYPTRLLHSEASVRALVFRASSGDRKKRPARKCSDKSIGPAIRYLTTENGHKQHLILRQLCVNMLLCLLFLNTSF